MTEQSREHALRRSVKEPDLFAAFYREHFDQVAAYLARRTCDPEMALELTAETFAQAYIGRARFRGSTEEEAEAWIYRIASRQLARYFRRGKASDKAMRRLGMEMPALGVDTLAEVERLADLADLRSVLRSELQRIPSSQREALWLRVVEELPYAEVGQRLDISEQAARARVSRGLRSLSDFLVDDIEPKEARA
jgi:RNA polymerase sigma factor (sigma-70 family)